MATFAQLLVARSSDALDVLGAPELALPLRIASALTG
jgi:hypothetical protein